jgi:hypothetical protein
MAKKVKPQLKTKEQTQLKKQAQKFLAKVPEEHIFWCHDGSVFRDMKELADGLAAMSDDIFAHHLNSEKNDFSNWVRDVIGDKQLANDLALVTSRVQTTECVATRLTILTSKVS